MRYERFVIVSSARFLGQVMGTRKGNLLSWWIRGRRVERINFGVNTDPEGKVMVMQVRSWLRTCALIKNR